MSKKGTVFGETRIHLLENPGFLRLGERERGLKSTNPH